MSSSLETCLDPPGGAGKLPGRGDDWNTVFSHHFTSETLSNHSVKPVTGRKLLILRWYTLHLSSVPPTWCCRSQTTCDPPHPLPYPGVTSKHLTKAAENCNFRIMTQTDGSTVINRQHFLTQQPVWQEGRCATEELNKLIMELKTHSFLILSVKVSTCLLSFFLLC